MLNDVRPPPLQAEPSREGYGGRGHHLRARVDLNEPGQHHARTMGEPTQIDPLYAMPMEERGSNFNIAMSIVTISLFAVLILSAWWTIR